MDGTGRGGMCLKMLDGRMTYKVGGGGGGGERKCIVRSHGSRLCEEENCFPRRKPSGKERRREMIDSSLAGSFMSCFSDNTGGSFVRW